MDDELINQKEYWKQNFSNKKVVCVSDDLQKNIARTKKGEPIKETEWNKTITHIHKLLKITKNSNVLELCCGNGVIIGEIAPNCNAAHGVDYSNELLKQLKINYSCNNLTTQLGDVMDLIIEPNYYDIIIFYFSIQHFNEKEAVLLINKSIESLKSNGRMLIGDIPDMDKKWQYINTPKYHIDYFNRVLSNKPKIGYWYQKGFFKALNSCFQNIKIHVIEQPKYQINSDHCFDILIKKRK